MAAMLLRADIAPAIIEQKNEHIALVEYVADAILVGYGILE